ncbi:hypothetical protein [Halothiobacillus sp. DCM-1]|uniref:hypothetical protein n=1 Tax=Halothiobacillus sp. DCM-1 TaxID=3112558 RepID=UPI003243AAC8
MPSRPARIQPLVLTVLLGLDLVLANLLSPQDHIGWPLAALALLPVLLLTLHALYPHLGRLGRGLALTIGLGLLTLLPPWLSQHIAALYLLQHLGANLALGLWFGLSLRPGQEPLVTRFARPLHPRFSPALHHYTRQVTLAWALFFMLMAAGSITLFLWAPRTVWSLFANAATLPLVALMFLGEFLMRRWALPPEDRLDPLSAWRAYRQATKASP